ncbi:hypothetical protein [Pelagibius sp. 7325]|uniref:hypothetical protein n=1 Tax=Pelagibius sp. 7325 TaxID=3131994 RepID=UPI0030EDF805
MRIPATLCLALLTLLPAAARAAASDDPDWPCIQRLVPRISAAQVWAGPEPDAATWQGDIEVSRLAARLAARRTPLNETEKLVEDFAEAQAKDAVNAKLTALFGRTLYVINQDRASIIAGIKRFAQRQRQLAERIRETRAKLRDGSGEASDNELREMLTWDLRIFDEREKSMTYLCEQPVLLEQRAFALGRTIYFFVED